MFMPALVRLCVATLVLLGGTFAFTGCQSTPSYDEQSSTRTLTAFANSSWALIQWTASDGRPVSIAKASTPTLQIGYESAISGNAGINRYFGKIRVNKDGDLDWSEALASTRMAGSPEAMQAEQQFMSDLKATTHVTVLGDRLTFTGKGKLKLVFARD